MHTHNFYMALAYGVSALLLVAEVAGLYIRWRRAPEKQNVPVREL